MAPSLKSDVWKYFEKDEKDKTLVCKICGTRLKDCGNTTNVWSHLGSKHEIKKPAKPSGNEARSNQDEDGRSETDLVKGLMTPSQGRMKRKRTLDDGEPSTGSKQPTLENIYEKAQSFQEGGVRDQGLRNALVYMICKDHMALQEPEKQGFRYFAKVAAPLWTPPSRQTATRLVEVKFDIARDAIRAELRAKKTLTVTLDIWTDDHTKASFLGGTVHFLENIEMESFILGIKHLTNPHDSNYLKAMIRELCDDWEIDIDNVGLCITDNAPNICKAARELFKYHTGCFDHTLNLIPAYTLDTDANKVEYVPGLPDFINKVKSIVTFFKNSVNASDDLLKEQLKRGKTKGTALKLSQEVATRWSSTYFMIVQFLLLSDVIGSIALKHPQITMLSGAELAELRLIGDIYHPFAEATTEMSAEKTTTASKVIPLVRLIKKVNF